MPEDPALWPAALAEGGLLDRLPPTDEDRRRAGFYQEERQRDEERARAGSLDEYLAGLGVEVSFVDPGPADLARLGQLVQKTNQFNLNQRRRSESELRDLCADHRYRVRLVSARDRFGDYGLVGAFVVELASRDLDSFLLSCRAMGRGIEEAMVADALEQVQGPLRATLLELPRNEPARRFFAGLGCTPGVSSPLRPQRWPSHVARR
jgi:FkbH-like protein